MLVAHLLYRWWATKNYLWLPGGADRGLPTLPLALPTITLRSLHLLVLAWVKARFRHQPAIPTHNLGKLRTPPMLLIAFFLLNFAFSPPPACIGFLAFYGANPSANV